MNKEEALELREATEFLVRLRVEREDLTARIAALESDVNYLTARIAALESDVNHLIGVDALTEKLYSDLLKEPLFHCLRDR